MRILLPLVPGLFGLALGALSPSSLAAQAPAVASASRPAAVTAPVPAPLPTVAAGDAAVDGRKLRVGTHEMRMQMFANDSMLGAASIRTAITEVSAGGEPGLLVAKTITFPRGTIYDSTLVRRRTMAPVWHHSTQPTRRMRLDFAPAIVTGAVSPNDSAATPVHHETEAPTFDSAVMEQVVGSLPLAAGYAARVPFYIYERGGLVWFDVRVTGDTTIALDGVATPAWTVHLERADMPMTYWIAKGSRELLREEASYGTGRRMVLSR